MLRLDIGRFWKLMTVAQTEGYEKFKALAVATDISPPGEYNTSSSSSSPPTSAALISENLASPCGMCRQLYVLLSLVSPPLSFSAALTPISLLESKLC